MRKLINRLCQIIWALMHENLSSGFVNNKDADQPAHLCSLISAFVIHLLESIIFKLATSEFSKKPQRHTLLHQGPYRPTYESEVFLP